MGKDTCLTREDTKIMKAIAVLLMLAHHLWAFPDRISGGGLKYIFSAYGTSSTMLIGGFGKICVPFFFFLGGYGVYLSSYQKQYDLITKLKKLYISYWKVFLIYVPIGFIFFGNQMVYCEREDICHKFLTFSWGGLIENFIGISSSYNSEWWFLYYYVIALISFPLIREIVERHTARINIFLVIISSVIVTNVLPALGSAEILGNMNSNYLYLKIICQDAPYIACFWMGIVVAKEGLLDRLKEGLQKNKLINLVVDIAVWLMIIYLRQIAIGDALDIFYIPLLCVVSIDFVQRCKVLSRILLAVGKESTNIWLIHSFYCYYFYFFVKIVVASRWALISLVVLVLLSYVSAIGVTYFWRGFSKGIRRIVTVKKENV